MFAGLTVLYSVLFLAELFRYYRTLRMWKRGEIGVSSVKARKSEAAGNEKQG